ncbi:unnamed protein product [Durusdinium trenchii]|uniref:Uncharacterized protein n=1 Tax=Durusdinium trenchii TaxID=1381693 RepID=A0ABP0QMQ3_9DINO
MQVGARIRPKAPSDTSSLQLQRVWGLSFPPSWRPPGASCSAIAKNATSKRKSLSKLPDCTGDSSSKFGPGYRTGPICIFSEDQKDLLINCYGLTGEKCAEKYQAPKALGLMDCVATFSVASHSSNVTNIGNAFRVGPWQDLNVDIKEMWKLGELGEMDRRSHQSALDDPGKCAPISRGGQFQISVSTQQTEQRRQRWITPPAGFAGLGPDGLRKSWRPRGRFITGNASH